MAAYDPITDTKVCGKCQLSKPGAEFNRRKAHGRDPYGGYCKQCTAILYREWLDKNREKKLAYLKDRRESSIGLYTQYDQIRNSKPETKERARQNRAANRERYRGYDRARYARERQAPGKYTEQDLQQIRVAQRDQCALCETSLSGKGHRDHIVALVNGGTNFPSNIQLLCRGCNHRKAATDIAIYKQRWGVGSLYSHPGRIKGAGCR